MAVYQAPEGYSFDPASGLWVKKMVVSDKAGVQYDHRYYFNADTGEYRQESFALGGERVKGNTYSKRKVVIIALVSIVAVVIVGFVISVLRQPNKQYFSEDVISEFNDMYDFDTVPDMTMQMEEYDGYFDEGGIIR